MSTATQPAGRCPWPSKNIASCEHISKAKPPKGATALSDAPSCAIFCAFAYLWEAGQRGKECCTLLLSDFRYQDLRCTEAWPDITARSLSPDLVLVVEGSQGTKTRHNRHPGVISLSKTPTAEGDGDPMAFLPQYAQAMAASGVPLTHWLFPNRFFSDADTKRRPHITSGALRLRLVLHLAQLGIWEGETLHSFRRGSSQHQQSQGRDPAAIAQRMLWRSPQSAELYLHPQRHRARMPPTSGPSDQVRLSSPVDNVVPGLRADPSPWPEGAGPPPLVRQMPHSDCPYDRQVLQLRPPGLGPPWAD